MNTDINIINETDLKTDRDQIEDVVCKTLKKAQFKSDYAISIIINSDKAVQALNKQYRGKDKPTNVLSFPAYCPDTPQVPNTPIELGDIVLAHETINREASEQNKDVSNHLIHLIIHGTLHLLGYDHETDDDAKEMESLEIDILTALGIQNPYT